MGRRRINQRAAVYVLRVISVAESSLPPNDRQEVCGSAFDRFWNHKMPPSLKLGYCGGTVLAPEAVNRRTG